jgi:DNA recombination-dependent growth factor C
MVRAPMPVLRGSITLARFRVELTPDASKDAARWLARGLRSKAFEPLDPRKPDEERAAGFVELEDSDAMEFPSGRLYQGQHALFAWRIDKVRIPGNALRVEMEKWTSSFSKEKGRPPSRGEKNETKAAIRQQLRSRTVPLSQVHDVSWNLKEQSLFVWASSRKIVDEIQIALEEVLPVRLVPMTPSAKAQASGMKDDALKPTPELSGVDAAEVPHGQA